MTVTSIYQINEVVKCIFLVIDVFLVNIGLLIFDNKMNMTFGNVINMLLNSPNIVLMTNISFLFQAFLFNVVTKYYIKKFAQNFIDRETTQTETDIILDNVGEAVFTYSKDGIQFVNT